MSERSQEQSISAFEARFFPEGVEVLIENWQPNALRIDEEEIVKKVRDRYGDVSVNDFPMAREFVLTDLLGAEWKKLLQEKFPGRVMETVRTQALRDKNENGGDIPWHRDGEGDEGFEDVILVLWSNREMTEVRDLVSKKAVQLRRFDVVTIDNKTYEHRRPPQCSNDRLFCHAAIEKVKPML